MTDQVISSTGIPAGDAHEIAGITYRQLDHWARQGWVTPSVDPGHGRSSRRLYSELDVVRLDLLRHLAMSRVNAAVAGPTVADVEIPERAVIVYWGPVGAKDNGDLGFHIIDTAEAIEFSTQGGAWVPYNPANVRARLRTAPRVEATQHEDEKGRQTA